MKKERNLLENLLKKIKYESWEEFENHDYWYIIKFFYIGSDYLRLSPGNFWLWGGVPTDLKIKCVCDTVLKIF